MDNALKLLWDWILSKDPVFGFIIGAVVVLSLLIWKFAGFYFTTKSAVKDIPSIKLSIGKIEKALLTMNALLLENGHIKQTCYSEANSPIKVNELGEKLLRESGAEKILKEITPAFLADLEGNSFNNPLELERACYQSLVSNMNDKRFSDLQTFAYNNPKFHDKPLRYFDILSVMALKLRDSYLEKHPKLAS